MKKEKNPTMVCVNMNSTIKTCSKVTNKIELNMSQFEFKINKSKC